MDTVQNRYEILETLGMGATSRVDKARDTLIGRIVALKTFLQGFGSRDLQQHFAREAQIIGRLSHPNIVALYDVGTDKDGVPYFVMEYVEGKTLETVLKGGALPLPRVAVWAGDLAAALGRAHRAKIIHGDVKPANILVTPEGQVKLGDFGVARFSTQVSGSGNVMGTPAYLSPEQILGNSQDTRSDLFSLGIVLYQMACGVRPFDGSSVSAVCAQIISTEPPPPSHHNPSLPPAFDKVVMRCLAKDPMARYPTAEALASSIYPFARSTEVAVPQTAIPAVSRPSPPKRSSARAQSWWNGPIKQKDLWVVAASLVIVLSAASAVRIARKHAIPTVSASAGVSSAGATSVATPVASGASGGRDSSTLVQVSKVSVIDPSSRDVTSSNFPSSPTPSFGELDEEISKSSAPSKPLRIYPAPTKRKSEKTRPVVPVAPVLPLTATNTGSSALAPDLRPLAHQTHTSLQIEINSAVANETLTVYSGQDLLFSTRLDPEHIGKPLQFSCPLSAGSHPLRVALYSANLSLHVQKEGLSEILPEGANILGIHINRRPKLLIRKETALEVTWPNPLSATTRPSSPETHAAGASR